MTSETNIDDIKSAFNKKADSENIDCLRRDMMREANRLYYEGYYKLINDFNRSNKRCSFIFGLLACGIISLLVVFIIYG